MEVFEVYCFDCEVKRPLKRFTSFEEAKKKFLFQQKQTRSFSYGIRRIVL